MPEEQIKDRFKKLREHLGLSQQAMADKFGIPVTNISKYERGVVTPSSVFLERMHVVLNVNLNWLVAGKGNMLLDKENIAKECYIDFIKENMNIDNEEIEKVLKEILASPVLLETITDFIKVKKGDKKALENLKHTISGIEFMFK